MTTRYSQKIAEKITNNGVDAQIIEHFLDMAYYAIERISPTKARIAIFELSDFATAKRRGISEFTLKLTRQKPTAREMWTAKFTRGNISLCVLLSVVVPR